MSDLNPMEEAAPKGVLLENGARVRALQNGNPLMIGTVRQHSSVMNGAGIYGTFLLTQVSSAQGPYLYVSYGWTPNGSYFGARYGSDPLGGNVEVKGITLESAE